MNPSLVQRSLLISPNGRRYGCVADSHDSRDKIYSAMLPAKRPAVMDFRPMLGPIKDQGQEGSCTGHGSSEHREFLYRSFFKWEKDQSVAAADFVASAAFPYYEARVAEGDPTQDNGAEVRDVMSVLCKQGVCLESTEPYQPGQFAVAPSDAQAAQALIYKLGAYHRIGSVDQLLSCLVSGYTAVMGFTVFEPFESLSGSAVLPMPGSEDQPLGGHCVHVVGYDEPARVFLIQNSWGKGWGDGGFFRMPFDYVARPDLVSDMWMAHLGNAWSASKTKAA